MYFFISFSFYIVIAVLCSYYDNEICLIIRSIHRNKKTVVRFFFILADFQTFFFFWKGFFQLRSFIYPLSLYTVVNLQIDTGFIFLNSLIL